MISLIVPSYNEQSNIVPLFEEVERTFHNEDYELIFVDDGSSDNTFNEIRKLYEVEPDKIKGIRFSRNFGKEAAMYAGFHHAVGDYIGVIDADLQQHPREVLRMKTILDENREVDIVCAYQEKRKEGFIGTIKTVFYKLINSISDVEFYIGASDFRLMRKKCVDSVLELGEYH